VRSGKMSPETLAAVENEACPTCGSCAGMFTANSMNCLTEAIGMALPGNGTIPAVMAARIRLAKETGIQAVDLVEKGITPRSIMSKEAFTNALTVDMALGCSTNTVLHLSAIAREAGKARSEKSERDQRPNAQPLLPEPCRQASPGGLDRAGGISAVLKELSEQG